MSEVIFNTLAGLSLFFITPALIFLVIRLNKLLKETLQQNEKLKIELTKLNAKHKK